MAGDGGGLSVPENTNWSEWNFSQVLLALTGEQLDLRKALDVDWLMFDESGETTRTPGTPSGHDIAYGAWDKFYYMVDYNEQGFDDWTRFVDRMSVVVDDLAKGRRGSLDLATLYRAHGKVVKYENWIKGSAADYRAWAVNLDSEDSGFSGKAAAVIQLRLKQNTEKLDDLYAQVGSNDGMPVSTALRDVYRALGRAIEMMSAMWYSAAPLLRALPHSKTGSRVERVQSHIRAAGITRDPEISDKDNPDYHLDDSSKEDALRLIDATMASFEAGDLSDKVAWSRMNNDISAEANPLLDLLDDLAREAMRIVHPAMLTATYALTELTDPKSTAKPPAGGTGGGGPIPPPGGGVEKNPPPDLKKFFEKLDGGPDGGPKDKPGPDPKDPGPGPDAGPEVKDPRKHLEDIVNGGPDGGPKDRPGADAHVPGGGPDAGQEGGIPPGFWPGMGPKRQGPADPEKRDPGGNPVPEFDSGGNPLPAPGSDERPPDPEAGFDGGFGTAPGLDGNPLPGLGSDGNPLPDPDDDSDGGFTAAPGSEGSPPPGLGSGGNPLPDPGGSPGGDFGSAGGSIGGDLQGGAPADPDAGLELGGDPAGSGGNGSGQPGASRDSGFNPGGAVNSGGSDRGGFTPPLPPHQTQLDGGPSTSGMGGGMPMMPPMMGGMGGMGGQGGDRQERERQTWLSEDEDVWGTDENTGFSVIGRPGDADYGLDEEVLSGPVRGPRQTPDNQAERETTGETTASGHA